MRPRIALATYEHAPSLAPDDRRLLPALARAGIDAEPAVWSSADVIWETFDGVMIRSCWDYHMRIAEFRAWLERLDASRLPVWNAVGLIEWNASKSYLIDLERRGVPIVATHLVSRGSAASVERIVREAGWPRFVLKPAVSASGYETHALDGAFGEDTRRVVAHVTALGDSLVQPFMPEVPAHGEYSLVFLDGAFSHAAIKRAAGAEFRVQTEHGGSVTPVEVQPWLIESASRAIGALTEVPLYARVDGVVSDDRFLLMELELIEPNLFLDLQPGADERLASAIMKRFS